MKRLGFLILCLLPALLLGGCLYPQDQKAESEIPNDQQLEIVQTAINEYQKKNDGILPIKTENQDTPIYQKYPIDFTKLTPIYLSEPPGDAYENGGDYQYVLINAEKKPLVKIFNLEIAEKIRELHIRIDIQGYPPFKAEIARDVYTLDYKKLGYKQEPYVISPYTGHTLPFVITGTGDIYVDYQSDLYQALKQKGQRKFKKGMDIRSILTDHSPFVPAYSLPYTVNEKNEPIFMAK
ncbi:hypothetical protein [Heyndrickxia acidicola]|uniref:Uncharacterized protein n=1 Tax=Heyndrickxia acidicola TaxID=209389 RepID=A0ABU6MMM9_9BACI|nr:hypothetical protein [Heyndrickxia acidicola]MED1204883.1 hypothetical protein [Heyndrickxia acidicola]